MAAAKATSEDRIRQRGGADVSVFVMCPLTKCKSDLDSVFSPDLHHIAKRASEALAPFQHSACPRANVL